MRTRSAIAAAVVVVAATLSACAGARLSSLQQEFESTYTRRADCTSGELAREDPVRCIGDRNREFLSLAKAAAGGAGDAGDRLTEIAFHRVAALAGWQSREPEGWALAEQSAAAGRALCDEVGAQEFSAPRDCALMRMIPLLVSHARTYAVLTGAWRAHESGAWSEDGNGEGFRRTADIYYESFWQQLSDLRSELEGDRDVHRSLLAYIERQRRPAYCTLFSMRDLAGLRANVVREADAALAATYQQLAERLKGEYREIEPDPTQLRCPGGPDESWLQ